MTTETKKISIDIGNDCKLVAEGPIDPSYREIAVGIESPDGYRDLVVIGQAYHYDKHGEIVFEDKADLYIYAKDNDDWTDNIAIDLSDTDTLE